LIILFWFLHCCDKAAHGLGVALGIFLTLNSWVNNKRLLMPFADQIEIDKGFWFVSPKKVG
jgi:hypothetical protein